jgi:two-component system phosphate regulon sensor histidine kinase PhoR
MQILINLLDNALKYTETGGVIVRARKAEEGYCIIAVRDTGIGVPKKHISRLGERFFRVDPSRSRELGGTGLGLAIVKHLVLAHGWRMSIESDLGAGTVVRLQIPV